MAVGEQTAQQSPISNEPDFSNWTVLFNGKWVPMPAFMNIQSAISTSVALFAFNLFKKISIKTLALNSSEDMAEKEFLETHLAFLVILLKAQIF